MSTVATTAASSAAALPFELNRLDRWLSERLPWFTGLQAAVKFAGGQSNPTYRLHAASGDLVMRCKPAATSQLLPSAHAIEREFRVMSSLSKTAVPVPHMHVLCEDESVIGRAFYVMDFVEGRVLWDQSLPDMSPADRGAHYDEMNRVIASLHSIDPASIGLGDYGRPEGFFNRQIARWSKQYRASQTDSLPVMEALMDWLPAHVPAVDESSIVHGDFRIDNLAFAPQEPRIIAVLDWELSTLGHPLSDFAYHCLSWHLSSSHFRGLAGTRPVEGIPTELEHIRRYCERSGRDIDEVLTHWPFYLAFNLFRLAGIAQGIVKRALEGTASNAQALDNRPLVEMLANAGWAAAQERSDA